MKRVEIMKAQREQALAEAAKATCPVEKRVKLEWAGLMEKGIAIRLALLKACCCQEL